MSKITYIFCFILLIFLLDKTIEEKSSISNLYNTDNKVTSRVLNKSNISSLKNENLLFDSNKEYKNEYNKNNFWKSVVSGFSLIFISEIGDNTFILAIIFSIKLGHILTFIATSSTLVLLNFTSLLIGKLIPVILYKPILDWIAIVVFSLFSIYMFIEGIKMDNKLLIEEINEENAENQDNELQEVLVENEDNINNNQSDAKEIKIIDSNTEQNNNKIKKEKNYDYNIVTRTFMYCGSLIIAECGDRSQITAITIAAVYDFKGVVIGSSLGHILATFIAVTIGKLFSRFISEKIITLIGSFLFLIFAIDFFITTKVLKN